MRRKPSSSAVEMQQLQRVRFCCARTSAPALDPLNRISHHCNIALKKEAEVKGPLTCNLPTVPTQVLPPVDLFERRRRNSAAGI